MDRAEIVERRGKAHRLVARDDVLDVGGVAQLFVRGELEHQPRGFEIHPRRGCQRGADTGLWLIDRVGHEIDRQLRARARWHVRAGQFDGLHPAGLVEPVAVLLGDGGEHLTGPLAVECPHQRLIAPDRPGGHFDDRLKRHRKGNRKRSAERQPSQLASM